MAGSGRRCESSFSWEELRRPKLTLPLRGKSSAWSSSSAYRRGCCGRSVAVVPVAGGNGLWLAAPRSEAQNAVSLPLSIWRRRLARRTGEGPEVVLFRLAEESGIAGCCPPR